MRIFFPLLLAATYARGMRPSFVRDADAAVAEAKDATNGARKQRSYAVVCIDRECARRVRQRERDAANRARRLKGVS